MCGNSFNWTDPIGLHKPADEGGFGFVDPLDVGGWKAKAAAKSAKEAKEQAAKDRAAIPPPAQAAKQPDQAALRSAATSRVGAPSGGGTSSTMLTGSEGVSPSLLSIGKNTLLGA